MTTTLLQAVASKQLDANGNGLVVLRPDVGQYWSPTFVRISTNSRVTPVAYCAVFHGSPGVPVQQSQFIDDTYLGSGDTSSIISGIAVVPGEAVLFNFVNGTPGDTAIVTVYGSQSDVPPNLSYLPGVPGTHFSGHLSTETITNTFVGAGSPIAVAPGGTLFITSSATGATADDVRQWNSFSFKLYAQTQANATNWNESRVDLIWYGGQNPLLGGGGVVMFHDNYSWWTNSPAGAFPCTNGLMEIEDVHHGPFWILQYTNGSATDTVNVNYQLVNSTRHLPGPFARQDTAGDGTLLYTGFQPIANATTIGLPAAFGYGRTYLSAVSGAAAITLSYNLAGAVGGAFDAPGLALNTRLKQELVLPKRALRVDVSNTSGSASSYGVFVFTQFDKQ